MIRIRVRSSGSRNRNAKPSRTRASQCATSPSTVARITGTTTKTRVAEVAKLTTSIQITAVGPMMLMSSPASGGPTRCVMRRIVSAAALSRSRRTCASRASPGRALWRAVIPGMSRIEPRKTSPMTCQISSWPSTASSGMTAIVAPLARSATMLTGRKPNRSTTAPPTTPPMTSGTSDAKPVSAVSAGEPVSWSTNHGSAMAAIMSPRPLSPDAARSATTPARTRRTGAGSTAGSAGCSGIRRILPAGGRRHGIC